MCGIIGIVGERAPFATLERGLEALEYRGYDSAGMAMVDLDSERLWRVRVAEQAHSLPKLAETEQDAPAAAGAAIAHTRWATHGAPTEANAHPHLDCTGTVAIVHNGIIENYQAFAEELEAAGHHFTSATDSEVLAHLVEAELAGGVTLLDAVRAIVPRLHGDFAIAVVHASEPEVLVGARRTSPLIVGVGDGVGILASDIAAGLATTRELFPIEDDEVVEVRPGSFVVYDRSGQITRPQRIEVHWDVADAQKGGYPDFMSKEIAEQPRAVRSTLLGRFDASGHTRLDELTISPSELAEFSRVMLIACGSSYHASLVGRQAIESWARLPTDADIASEFRYRDAVVGSETLVVAVSQSGETADTLHAMREARRRGGRVIAMTNVVDSVMAREADGALYTRAGPEIGVASTKCHVVQIALLEVLALHLAQARGTLEVDQAATIAADLDSVADRIEGALAREDAYRALGAQFAATEDVYFLGRKVGFPVALEGALKLKELAYVRAEGYPAGEMKHGPLSLIEPGAVVIVLANRSTMWDKVRSNIKEVQARGATVLAVIDEGDAETASLVDGVFEVPRSSELTAALVNVVPLQCFAHEVALRRGNDVDRPRNLAKVVTVE
jgi:glutamine---fructose-6-phosphate transaminase (isomerizing)